jgi:hypothetical protein
MTRQKSRDNARKAGVLTVVLSLFVLGLVAYFSGTERSQLVYEDMKKVQGTYTGFFYQRGRLNLTVVTNQGDYKSISVEDSIKVRFPKPGQLVEVLYEDQNGFPKLTKAEDIRVITVADTGNPGKGVHY